jgi:hypothetical protein
MLNLSIVRLFTDNATECPSRVRVKCGTKVSEKTGSVSFLYLSFRMVGALFTSAEVLTALDKMDKRPVSVSVPRHDDGIMDIAVKPIMTAAGLAKVLRQLEKSAEERREQREAASADNVTIPAPKGKAPRKVKLAPDATEVSPAGESVPQAESNGVPVS